MVICELYLHDTWQSKKWWNDATSTFRFSFEPNFREKSELMMGVWGSCRGKFYDRNLIMYRIAYIVREGNRNNFSVVGLTYFRKFWSIVFLKWVRLHHLSSLSITRSGSNISKVDRFWQPKYFSGLKSPEVQGAPESVLFRMSSIRPAYLIVDDWLTSWDKQVSEFCLASNEIWNRRQKELWTLLSQMSQLASACSHTMLCFESIGATPRAIKFLRVLACFIESLMNSWLKLWSDSTITRLARQPCMSRSNSFAVYTSVSSAWRRKAILQILIVVHFHNCTTELPISWRYGVLFKWQPLGLMPLFFDHMQVFGQH